MAGKKHNIPMCLALVLLCLTMITTHLTSGLYARYTTTASGSDGARVAKFDVDFTVKQEGTSGDTFVVTVNNRSDVAVEYSIEVAPGSHMSVALDGDEAKEPADGEDTVVFTDDTWTLAQGENSEQHTLKFAVTDWANITGSTDSGDSEDVSLDFEVFVTVDQMD